MKKALTVYGDEDEHREELEEAPDGVLGAEDTLASALAQENGDDARQRGRPKSRRWRRSSHYMREEI